MQSLLQEAPQDLMVWEMLEMRKEVMDVSEDNSRQQTEG
jgi:hypothetical protein